MPKEKVEGVEDQVSSSPRAAILVFFQKMLAHMSGIWLAARTPLQQILFYGSHICLNGFGAVTAEQELFTQEGEIVMHATACITRR